MCFLTLPVIRWVGGRNTEKDSKNPIPVLQYKYWSEQKSEKEEKLWMISGLVYLSGRRGGIWFFYEAEAYLLWFFYPFQILSRHHFRRIDFAPVTILYGGNGTGKTTAINVIAEKLGLDRDSAFNRSNFFWDYLERCDLKRASRSQVRAGLSQATMCLIICWIFAVWMRESTGRRRVFLRNIWMQSIHIFRWVIGWLWEIKESK